MFNMYDSISKFPAQPMQSQILFFLHSQMVQKNQQLSSLPCQIHFNYYKTKISKKFEDCKGRLINPSSPASFKYYRSYCQESIYEFSGILDTNNFFYSFNLMHALSDLWSANGKHDCPIEPSLIFIYVSIFFPELMSFIHSTCKILIHFGLFRYNITGQINGTDNIQSNSHSPVLNVKLILQYINGKAFHDNCSKKVLSLFYHESCVTFLF